MSQIHRSIARVSRSDGAPKAKPGQSRFRFRLAAPVRVTILLFGFVVLSVVIGSSSAVGAEAAPPRKVSEANEEAILPEKLKMLHDPTTSENDFRDILSVLPYIATEPPSVWADIVADSRYDNRRRKIALAVLLRRKVKSRISLSELARLIPKNHLFTIADIQTVERFSTEPRPRFWAIGNVFLVRIASAKDFYEISADYYFVLDRNGGAAKMMLLSALQGQDPVELKDARLLDFYPMFGAKAWPNFP